MTHALLGAATVAEPAPQRRTGLRTEVRSPVGVDAAAPQPIHVSQLPVSFSRSAASASSEARVPVAGGASEPEEE